MIFENISDFYDIIFILSEIKSRLFWYRNYCSTPIIFPAIVKIVIFSVRPQKSNTIFVIIWKPLVVEQWFLYQCDCILMPNNIWQVTLRFNDTDFFSNGAYFANFSGRAHWLKFVEKIWKKITMVFNPSRTV